VRLSPSIWPVSVQTRMLLLRPAYVRKNHPSYYATQEESHSRQVALMGACRSCDSVPTTWGPCRRGIGTLPLRLLRHSALTRISASASRCGRTEARARTLKWPTNLPTLPGCIDRLLTQDSISESKSGASSTYAPRRTLAESDHHSAPGDAGCHDSRRPRIVK
jgi:hypothetical protein